jgi:hypothetical protein
MLQQKTGVQASVFQFFEERRAFFIDVPAGKKAPPCRSCAARFFMSSVFNPFSLFILSLVSTIKVPVLIIIHEKCFSEVKIRNNNTPEITIVTVHAPSKGVNM